MFPGLYRRFQVLPSTSKYYQLSPFSYLVKSYMSPTMKHSKAVQKFQLQWCRWQVDLGDIFWIRVIIKKDSGCWWSKWPKPSPTLFVSNIRHQHRCSRNSREIFYQKASRIKHFSVWQKNSPKLIGVN